MSWAGVFSHDIFGGFWVGGGRGGTNLFPNGACPPELDPCNLANQSKEIDRCQNLLDQTYKCVTYVRKKPAIHGRSSESEPFLSAWGVFLLIDQTSKTITLKRETVRQIEDAELLESGGTKSTQNYGLPVQA